jgi:sigma-B regulation protein RsbU (phosphoserine phosphatase)
MPFGNEIARSAARQPNLLEQKFRDLLEAAPDGLVVVKEPGIIVLVNAQAEKLFGYRREELLGKPLEMLVPERFREQHVEHCRRFFANPLPRPMEGPQSRSYVGRIKDGSEFPADIALSPLRTEEGLLLIAAVRDVSVRQHAEQALRARAHEFALARQIQQALVPRAVPQLPGFTIAGACQPAQETAGDYWDAIPLPCGRCAIAIGDVSGHGIGAALMMVETRACLRALLTHADLSQILALINKHLRTDFLSTDRFVTLLLLAIDPRTRCLTYSNAGHCPAYVLDRQGEVRAILQATAPPLTVESEDDFPSGPVTVLQPGDIVFLWTDGLSETESAEGKLFGCQRALEVVRTHRHKEPEHILESLFRARRDFAGNQAQVDDVTAVIIKVAIAA